LNSIYYFPNIITQITSYARIEVLIEGPPNSIELRPVAKLQQSRNPPTVCRDSQGVDAEMAKRGTSIPNMTTWRKWRIIKIYNTSLYSILPRQFIYFWKFKKKKKKSIHTYSSHAAPYQQQEREPKKENPRHNTRIQEKAKKR
jgi:hypothetical protein